MFSSSKGKKNEGGKQYIDEEVQENEVVFKNLQILSKKKDEIEKILMERKLSNLKQDMNRTVRNHFEKTYQSEIKVRARAILNSVRLYFEAFEVDKPTQPLCSLFSDVIANQKAAAKGDLRICRLSQIYGSWKGGDEIILLCEKVQKDNINVKFFETDEDGTVIWNAYGSFSPVDVHHQVAITFKTPAYKENVDKTVFICLERNGEESEAREFTYKSEGPPCKKRKLESYHSASSENAESSETSVSSMTISSPDSSSNDASNEMQSNFDLNFEDFNIDPTFTNFLLNSEDTDFKLPFEIIDDPLDDGLMYEDVTDSPKASVIKEQIQNHSLNLIDIDTGIRDLKLDEDCQSEFKNLNKFKKESGLSKNLSSHLKCKKNICFNFLSKKDKYGNTLLHIAVLLNRNIEEILKMCYSAKIDLTNVQNCNNQTPLHLAVERNEIEATEILLVSGCNPNIKDSHGNNCYHIVARNGSIPVLKAIYARSKFSHNVHDYNDEGLTPMHVAIMQKKSRCLIQWLKLHLTDPNVMEKKAGRSLLHYAIDYLPSLLPKLLQMPKINVDIQDFEGNTPLHIACSCENIEAVRHLLQSGANPLLKNFKQNCNSLDQENSEDEISDGQLPSELTTNIEILDLLSNAMAVKAVIETEEELPENLPISGNSQESDGMSAKVVEKLCKYLDEEMKWQKLAPFFLEPDMMEGLNLSDSPSRALLDFIKKKEQDKYLERLKTAFEFADLSDALSIMNEQS